MRRFKSACRLQVKRFHLLMGALFSFYHTKVKIANCFEQEKAPPVNWFRRSLFAVKTAEEECVFRLLQEGLAFIFIFPEGIIPAADKPSNGDGKQIIFIIPRCRAWRRAGYRRGSRLLLSFRRFRACNTLIRYLQ